MITTGIIPDSFKISKITPLFKKGDTSCYQITNQFHFCQQSQKCLKEFYIINWYEYFNSNNLLAEQ